MAFSISAEFEGGKHIGVFEELKFKGKGKKVKARAGYDGKKAPYAIYVHERTDVHHPVGQAKFLEEAFEDSEEEMVEAMAAVLRKGKSMRLAVWKAIEVLRQASQALVPVATGNLRDSWFPSDVGDLDEE